MPASTCKSGSTWRPTSRQGPKSGLYAPSQRAPASETRTHTLIIYVRNNLGMHTAASILRHNVMVFSCREGKSFGKGV
jgi:hypothetical protein